MNWFKPKKKTRTRTRTVTKTVVDWSPLTLTYWFQSPSRIDYMRRLIETPEFQEVINVMVNAEPDYTGCSDNSQRLGRHEGYRLYHDALLSLAHEPPKQQFIEPTYEDG
jgi:hypothetical protein